MACFYIYHETHTVKHSKYIIFSLLFFRCVAAMAQPVYMVDGSSPVSVKNWVSFTRNDSVFHRFILQDTSGIDKEYFIQTGKTGVLTAWIWQDNKVSVEQSGSHLPLKARSLPSNVNGIVLILKANRRAIITLHVNPVYSLYADTPADVSVRSLVEFEKSDSQRLLWQGLFLGVILVMALYNLIIYLTVKDLSYLYYVLSIIGIGLYFCFYYGIGMEYLWSRFPVWDNYLFTMVVPFNGLVRIYFTRTYLQTSRILQRTDRFLNVLAGICIAAIAWGLISFIWQLDGLVYSVQAVGILGTIILIMMLYGGIIAYYRQQYEPAKYFIYANVLLVMGGALFNLREMHLIPDNFITRYVVQIGTLIQVIFFALGLASRYNSTRSELAREILERQRLTLESERQKKEMIELQRAELQEQVHQQTAYLQLQNQQLEEIVEKLKASECKLTQLNQLKDKLFSIISHDLRNPLATMQATLKLITEHHNKLSAEEQQRLTTEAQESLDNLNTLLYNLLQWSRSQMNLLQFKPEKIQLLQIVEKAAKVSRLHAHMKDITLQLNVPSDLHCMADRDMLEFIFRNLLSNAVKFSYRHSTVQVSAGISGKWIQAKVIDQGMGISPSGIQKLLQNNTAFSRKGTEKEKGSGLGLMITKEFIEKNGGQLLIEPNEKKGTAFIVLLPIFDSTDIG